MTTAKDLLVQPIKAGIANDFVKAHHYSGKVAQNSQLHLGVFLEGRLHGVMQFGPSLDKRKIQGLVSGTLWHEFLELNRMAFDDVLPRNSESRALSVAWRLLKKHAPQVKWVVSFADGTQCGDGTIYRAAGFVLTGFTKANEFYKLPNGESVMSATLRLSGYTQWLAPYMSRKEFDDLSNFGSTSKRVMEKLEKAGAVKLDGFSIRYIYFIDPAYRARLTVPELPFSEIERRGASMYKGQKTTRGISADGGTSESHSEGGGSIPTIPLICGQGEIDNAPGTNPEIEDARSI